MKKLLAAAVLVAGTFASFSAANAAAFAGGCQPMRRAVVVRPAPIVVAPAPVVVVRPGPRPRVCPYGTVWRNGRCRGW